MSSLEFRLSKLSLGTRKRTEIECNGDRFIRSSALVTRISHEIAVGESPTSKSKDKILFKDLYSEAEEEYRRLIFENLLDRSRPKIPWIPHWPVKYRIKPCIGPADIVLDLPDARQSFCDTVMDWGASNFIAVAFPRSVYLWDAATSTTSVIYSAQTTCVKWSRCGRYLFRATRTNVLSLMDLEKRLNLDVKPLPRTCHLNTCYVTCTAFHPSKPIVLTGCNKGGIACYAMKETGLEGLKVKDWYTSSVSQLQFNCNGQFFSVTTMNGWVGVAPSLESNILEFKLQAPSRSQAWHPWNPKLLVVGDLLGNMYAYKMTGSDNMECVAKYHCAYDAAIWALSFNPLTAELVVSQRVYRLARVDGVVLDDDEQNKPETIISVLASFDRVVDRMTGHSGRVHVLCWSPDGTKLATSGSDETARIWNFVDKKRILKRKEETQRKEMIKSGHLDFKAFTLR